MEEMNVITCIVQRGYADQVVNAAIDAGAQGATITYGRGTGVRQKLGFLARFIVPEKETIIIVTRGAETEPVFQAVVEAGKLHKKGRGFAYITKATQAVGFL